MIRRQRQKRKLNADINVVPYIDVMMVLLVIFMITAPMLTQGVDVDLPHAAAEPVNTQSQEPVVVTVDKHGRFYIDVGTSDPAAPIDATILVERVKKVLAAQPKTLLLVRGDKAVNYDRVIQLMSLLKSAGAQSVGLVTE